MRKPQSTCVGCAQDHPQARELTRQTLTTQQNAVLLTGMVCAWRKALREAWETQAQASGGPHQWSYVGTYLIPPATLKRVQNVPNQGLL